MTPFDASALRAFCRPPQGVPVAFGGVSVYEDGTPICGLFDRPVAMKLTESGIGGVESALPELRLPYNAFAAMPESGDTVTLTDNATGATTDYIVSAPTAEDDGAFVCYELNLGTS